MPVSPRGFRCALAGLSLLLAVSRCSTQPAAGANLANTGNDTVVQITASLAFGSNGEFLFVSNLALDLRVFGLPQAVDSQWCAEVRQFTVSRIRTNVRPFGG